MTAKERQRRHQLEIEGQGGEGIRDRFLEWRGIDKELDTVCTRCGGSGVKAYPDTSTWRHRVGGQQVTQDVCDKCWGSGAENRPWINWRWLPLWE